VKDLSRIIAIANQKGGVGKTTTSVSLAAALAELGRRVLLLDVDPQGNATSGFGIDKGRVEKSVYDVLIEAENIQEAIQKTEFKVDVLPANIDLAGAEVELVTADNRENRLKKALSLVRDKYDYILMDCPPSLGFLTLNALTASDTLLMPVQCEFYALEGMTQLLDTMELVQGGLNPDLVIEGVLMTMYDGRTNLALQVVNEVRDHFDKLVFKTMIPRTVRLSEAPSYGQPITAYDPRSKGAEVYRDLAKEVVSRDE
jgi:chromosome partitioning protein